MHPFQLSVVEHDRNEVVVCLLNVAFLVALQVGKPFRRFKLVGVNVAKVGIYLGVLLINEKLMRALIVLAKVNHCQE